MNFLRGFKTFLQNQHMPLFKLTKKSNLKEEENANAAKQMCNQSAIIRKKGKMAQNAETKNHAFAYSVSAPIPNCEFVSPSSATV